MKKRYIIAGIILVFIMIGIILFFTFSNKEDSSNIIKNFQINDTLPQGNKSEVKVILLAGQSNASGCSHISELKGKIDVDKYKEYEEGYDNIYINYFNDNGVNKSEGFVNVKLGQGANYTLFGPEIGMAEKLHSISKDEKIFIIKYAWGGTNLHTQWNSNKNQLYSAFSIFVKQSLDYLIGKDYIPNIVAMMWMQGESDANFVNSILYRSRLEKLVINIREELSLYIKENMYFVDAYISDSPYWISYKMINKAKQKHCNNEYNVCIDTINEKLEYDKEPTDNLDLAHYDSLSEIKLGNLFIEKSYHIFS